MAKAQMTTDASRDSGEPLDQALATLTRGADTTRDALARTDRGLRDAARAHPLLTLAGATLAGFLLGRLISRR